jgi:DNA-binding transcriptional ArsR family regulator
LKRKHSEHKLDLVFHAISDRTRRSLLARLAGGPANITELARPFEMSLPAVSKHLRVLESARLVTRTVEGRVHCCALAPKPLQEAERWLNDYRSFWTSALDGLARYVENEKQTKGR